MDRLTPLAASFLEGEDVDPTASLAIGSFAIFEGPAPDFEEFVRSIEGQLPLIPAIARSCAVWRSVSQPRPGSRTRTSTCTGASGALPCRHLVGGARSKGCSAA